MRRRARPAARSRAGVRATRKGSIAWGGAPSPAGPTGTGRLGMCQWPTRARLGGAWPRAPGRGRRRRRIHLPAGDTGLTRTRASVQFGIGTSLPVVLLKVPSDGPCSESAEIFYVDPMSRASGARDSSDQPYLYRTTRLKAAMPLSSDGTGLALRWKLDVMISISDSLTMSLTSAMRRICSRFR